MDERHPCRQIGETHRRNDKKSHIGKREKRETMTVQGSTQPANLVRVAGETKPYRESKENRMSMDVREARDVQVAKTRTNQNAKLRGNDYWYISGLMKADRIIGEQQVVGKWRVVMAGR